jgi:DNA-binding beta-propeller fold protein YncE
MHTTRKHTARIAPGPRAGLLALAALGLLSLAAAPARAQTQDLFVSNAGFGSIQRFTGTGPGTFTPTGTTLAGSGLSFPEGLAFDSRGNLFAAGFNAGTITEFAAGATPGSLGAGQTVATGLSGPLGLAFDPRGNLFVAGFNSGTITEFMSTGLGTLGTGTTFASGLNNPYGLAVDARGDLLVANSGANTISEFAFNAVTGTFGAAQTVATGVSSPTGLAVNARGDLFVSNNTANTITEFAAGATPGTFATTGTIFATGLSSPDGLAFDALGNLYVANFSRFITKFAFTPGVNGAAGTFAAGQDIVTGVSAPTFLAFSPVPAVPEASTTVSFGLLLVLGLGGLVVSARRRKAASAL